MIAAESLCGRFCFLVYQCMRPRSSSSFFSVLSRVSRVALTDRQLPSCARLGPPGAAVPPQPWDGRARRSLYGRITLAEVWVSGYDSSSPPTKY